MEISNLDWNSSMYYVYDEEFNSDTAPSYDDINGDVIIPSTGGDYTEEEKNKVSEAYEHANTKGNPHETQIGDIPGLNEELQSIKDDVDNAIVGVEGGGAVVVNTDEGRKISLEVNTDSAVDIRDGKITLEWEG